MTATEDLLLPKKKEQRFATDTVNGNNKYLNLNLNQNQKCFDKLQASFSKSKNDTKFAAGSLKKPDSVDFKNYKEKEVLQKWGKSAINSSKFVKPFNHEKDETEKEVKNRWKNISSNSTTTTENASTLSLHIAAYENLIEAGDTVTSSSSIDDRDKELKNAKFGFVCSTTSIIQNPSEFPRQQEEKDKNLKPEIAQFKASQKLLNPNKLASSSSTDSQQSKMSKHTDRRTSILKPLDENPVEPSKVKRRVSFHTHRTVKEFDKAELGDDQTPKNESIHYSGSSEERSTFFGGSRPGSALTFTSHQHTDIIVKNDGNVTMNTTANATIAVFDRVGNGASAVSSDEENTTNSDPTVAFLGHLQPLTTPVRNISNNQDDPTIALIEKFKPELLTPEARSSPKRLAEIYEDITRPVHISSPTSDKNPHEVDPEVTKAFESCNLSPVKHLQETRHYVEEEEQQKHESRMKEFEEKQREEPMALTTPKRDSKKKVVVTPRQAHIPLKKGKNDLSPKQLDFDIQSPVRKHKKPTPTKSQGSDSVFGSEQHSHSAGNEDLLNYDELLPEEQIPQQPKERYDTEEHEEDHLSEQNRNSTFAERSASNRSVNQEDPTLAVFRKISSEIPASHDAPMNSTYVVAVSVAGGRYLEDESDTMNPSSEAMDNKTYLVDANDKYKIDRSNFEMTSISGSSSTTSSFHAPKHSEVTLKKYRRLSDIINRERRRSSILTAATSAANSPAIEEEKSMHHSIMLEQQSQLHSSMTQKSTQHSTMSPAIATMNLSLAKSTVEKTPNCSVDMFDDDVQMNESPLLSTDEKINSSIIGGGHESLADNFEQMLPMQRLETSLQNNGTQLLEDVQTPTKYFEDSNFTMPKPTGSSHSSFTQPKPSAKEDAVLTMQKLTVTDSLKSPKNLLNKTFEAEPPSESLNLSYGLPAVDKKLLKREEPPKINQTPGWSKYSKCLEAMQKLSEKEKQEQAIAMESFDEEPNYMHGDSIMMNPTTPKKLLLSSMSYRQEYRDRNLEEPTDSFSEQDKENRSSGFANNSTLHKASTTLEHKSFQLSRFGCVERQFAPDIAFCIENVIREVQKLKILIKNLNIDLPGFDDVVPEFLIYDDQLAITHYKLITKIALIDAEFSSFNNDKDAWEKFDDLKIVEEQLEVIEKVVAQVVTELKLTSFDYEKFTKKVADYFIRSSNDALEAYKKNIHESISKVENLKAVYRRRANEMTQELQAQLENTNKAKAAMSVRFNDIIEKYGNFVEGILSDKR